MIKISIIGAGNVASHLATAFMASERIQLLQLYARRTDVAMALPAGVAVVHELGALDVADLYIIAVSDSAIAGISAQLPFGDRLVVHTSGTMPFETIDPKNRRGVFYPLQTFSKEKPVVSDQIPLCIEAENSADQTLLFEVANAISEQVYAINGTQRQALHVAAVFVNNFVNQLYTVAEQICNDNGLPFDMLKPLIRETSEKVMSLSPRAAQTGPASRNDLQTIAAHTAFLTDPNIKEIYTLLTQSILSNGQKL